ncbi:MAG: hypothetical protein GWP08_17720 [Nitrospiraceae bacterium]|nr:hypothetical protein [Nitrospiraceae bacterium]
MVHVQRMRSVVGFACLAVAVNAGLAGCVPAEPPVLDIGTVIAVNAGKAIKPVGLKFGTSVGALHRGPGWPPADLSDQRVIDLINEVKPAFINLQYTMSPMSVEHVIGFPFFPESTGEFSQRLSYIEMLERIGIDSSSTGGEGDLYALFTSTDSLPDGPVTFDGVPYNTYAALLGRPPHKNYDDLLQFFERLDEPPELFIRVPIIFLTYIDDPFPHSGEGRATISVDLDPQTGAQMVHYFNDPYYAGDPENTSELAALRAANGHPEPYNVKYYMLGNELWWPHVDIGLSMDRIVDQTIAFSKAMKEADPSITIVINPVNDSYPDSFLRTDDPVQGPIIEKLRRFNKEFIPRTRGFVDAVEFFVYGIGVGDGVAEPYLNKNGWKYLMAQCYVYEKYGVDDRHRQIADQYGPDVNVILGEFSGPSTRLGGAIYDADYTIFLLNNDYDDFIANWNLGLIETSNYGLIDRDVTDARPPIKQPYFYVLKMFNNYFGDMIVETKIADSPLFDVAGHDTSKLLILPPEQGVPSLNTIATTKGDALYLMVVNRNLDSAIQAEIAIEEFLPASTAEVYTLNGPSIDATNHDNPENVRITESTIRDASSSFLYTFEKHSVTVIVFHVKGKE